MIPKILCFIFGHRLWADVYTGNTAVITDRLTGGDRKIPIMTKKKNSDCPRCGKRIKWEGVEEGEEEGEHMINVAIKEPFWKEKAVGIAEDIITNDICVTIDYKNKYGTKTYPYKYFMAKEKALTYPKFMRKGRVLRIIKIDDMEVRK